MANNKIKLHLFLIISSFLLTKDLNLLLLPKIILLFLLTSLYFNLIINYLGWPGMESPKFIFQYFHVMAPALMLAQRLIKVL